MNELLFFVLFFACQALRLSQRPPCVTDERGGSQPKKKLKGSEKQSKPPIPNNEQREPLPATDLGYSVRNFPTYTLFKMRLCSDISQQPPLEGLIMNFFSKAGRKSFIYRGVTSVQ